MKKIGQEEFHDRIGAIIRARKIFIPHLTKNITIAFELYQEVLAEQKRMRFLTVATGGRLPPSQLDQYERPLCPQCKEPLYLRVINEPKGRGNRKGWKTCWICMKPQCIYERFSKRSLNDWMRKLKKKSK